MAFADGTRDRVMGVLGLPVVSPFWVQQVDDALDRASNYGGVAAESRISGYLDSYESAETSLNADAGDAGIKRLDVIEYFENSATMGYSKEMHRYRQLILNALFIPEERQQIIRESGMFQSNRISILR